MDEPPARLAPVQLVDRDVQGERGPELLQRPLDILEELEKFAALAFVVLFNDVAEDPTKDCPIKRELKLKRERLFDNYVDEGSNEGLGDFISTLSRMAAFYDIYQNRKEPNHVLSPVCSG